MEPVVTADLSNFGRRELRRAVELLEALTTIEPEFLGDGLTLNFNMDSGNVFLSDEDYNVGMMNRNKLEQWFTCPYCGHEGFIHEMKHDAVNQACTDYMEQIGV